MYMDYVDMYIIIKDLFLSTNDNNNNNGWTSWTSWTE